MLDIFCTEANLPHWTYYSWGQTGVRISIDGIKLAKSTGVSLSEVLKQLPSYYNLLHALFPDVTQQEAINYIKNNWNKY